MSDRVGARIQQNLQAVRQRCQAAASRSGRPVDAVRLIGVTKYFGVDIAQRLAAAGCHDLAENRPQQLWEKAEAWSEAFPEAFPDSSDESSADARTTVPTITWHMIGHLQRNKVARTLRYATWIHSGDSLRLLEEIDRCAGNPADNRVKCPVSILLEVNVSGDGGKGGFRPEELPGILKQAATLSNLSIRGLMTMASLQRPGAEARADFAALRELRDELRAHAPPEVSLDELSMGMSGDFEVAIEEGATMVRVGSALFEGISG